MTPVPSLMLLQPGWTRGRRRFSIMKRSARSPPVVPVAVTPPCPGREKLRTNAIAYVLVTAGFGGMALLYGVSMALEGAIQGHQPESTVGGSGRFIFASFFLLLGLGFLVPAAIAVLSPAKMNRIADRAFSRYTRSAGSWQPMPS